MLKEINNFRKYTMENMSILKTERSNCLQGQCSTPGPGRKCCQIGLQMKGIQSQGTVVLCMESTEVYLYMGEYFGVT